MLDEHPSPIKHAVDDEFEFDSAVVIGGGFGQRQINQHP
jgi:hypothetical protein